MSNYTMQVDFFGNTVRCETEGLMVSLNDLVIAGNAWRLNNQLSIKPIDSIIRTKSFEEFKRSVAEELGVDEGGLLHIVKGRSGRTMAHLYLAIYVAEQISSKFHVRVIKTFVEGKLLEFRELGGTEFKNLNAGIDQHLPGREGKPDNRGVYIQVAKLLRTKILGQEAVAGDWDKASVSQIHLRYEWENRLIDYLKMGFVKDYEHLKELIQKL